MAAQTADFPPSQMRVSAALGGLSRRVGLAGQGPSLPEPAPQRDQVITGLYVLSVCLNASQSGWEKNIF